MSTSPLSDLSPPRCLILIATYNEIDNLPRLVSQIHQRHPRVDILIVDDHSPDGTGDWVTEFAQQNSWCHLISRAGKLGLGSATVTGFRWALDRDYSYVLTMDADFSHDPADIERLFAIVDSQACKASRNQSNDSTIAIGSRYVTGGRIEGWPWHRRWASRWINRFARLWLGLPTRDNSGAFRCYPSALLRKVPLEKIRNQGYGYLEEILWLARQVGAEFVEVPITFRDRTQGQSKINANEAIAALRTLFQLRFRR